MDPTQPTVTDPPRHEIPFRAMSGWGPLLGLFLALAAGAALVAMAVRTENPVYVLPAILLFLGAFLTLFGFFLVNPNTARVLVLFGRYRGSVRSDGFYWTNPFAVKKRVSLRARNLASQNVKVNDLAGNPIEIGAVVVWRVRDTAQALFEVDEYETYADVQVEAAVRELAKAHPYDEQAMDTDVPSLRGNAAEVTAVLQEEVQSRLDRAGIEVLEARVTHLAYAPEIASAMPQRQQASAIVAAREKIVEGAVSMVEQALDDLARKHIVELNDEHRTAMVANLLVVLCSHSAATPVLQTGSQV